MALVRVLELVHECDAIPFADRVKEAPLRQFLAFALRRTRHDLGRPQYHVVEGQQRRCLLQFQESRHCEFRQLEKQLFLPDGLCSVLGLFRGDRNFHRLARLFIPRAADHVLDFFDKIGDRLDLDILQNLVQPPLILTAEGLASQRLQDGLVRQGLAVAADFAFHRHAVLEGVF